MQIKTDTRMQFPKHTIRSKMKQSLQNTTILLNNLLHCTKKKFIQSIGFQKKIYPLRLPKMKAVLMKNMQQKLTSSTTQISSTAFSAGVQIRNDKNCKKPLPPPKKKIIDYMTTGRSE